MSFLIQDLQIVVGNSHKGMISNTSFFLLQEKPIDEYKEKEKEEKLAKDKEKQERISKRIKKKAELLEKKENKQPRSTRINAKKQCNETSTEM